MVVGSSARRRRANRLTTGSLYQDVLATGSSVPVHLAFPPTVGLLRVRWKTAPCSEADSSMRQMAGGSEILRITMDEGVDVFMVRD